MDKEEVVFEECPKKKPIYKKWWFWAIVAIACIIAFIIFFGNEPSDLIDLPENEYRELCKTYTYDEIARNPDKYEKSLAKFTGEVIQVLKDGDEIQMRVNVTCEDFYYTDTVFVFYNASNKTNVLEGDIVTMYGELRGMQEYESVLGQEISIPRIYVKFIDIVK